MIKVNDILEVKNIETGKIKNRQVKSIIVDFMKNDNSLDDQYSINIEFYDYDDVGLNDYWFNHLGINIDNLIQINIKLS